MFFSLRILSLIVLVGVLSGCSSISYYAQSVSGQVDIWRKAQPIDEVLQRHEVPNETKRKLRLVVEARRYAVDVLGLPDNDSYTEFVALDRRFVVWNVFAAPELSLKPREWCFPVVGCVSYRGYFEKAAAEKYANNLAAKGDDVFVGGVPAYSTLGWFDDPVLSSVLQYRDEDLVGLLFHELSHQVAFAKGDTVFNESFANTVEQVGVERWLRDHGDESRIDRYLRRKHRSQEVIDLILKYRERLEALFYSDRPVELKRSGKSELIAELKHAFLELTRQWPEYDGFKRWFSGPVNNAQLVSISTYNDWVPAFQQLLSQHEGSLNEFYRAVQQVASWSKGERETYMSSLIE